MTKQTMEIIDTHTHLYDEAFVSDVDMVITNALGCGVSTMLVPAIDRSTFDGMLALCSRYPQTLLPMIGVHPTSIKEDYNQELELVEQQLKLFSDRYIAVGEIGLDFYWDTTFAAEQKDALIKQLQWANQYNKPVDLHIRNAYAEMFEILKDIEVHRKGVFHCFSGDISEAWKAVEMGYALGIGGVATFKKSLLVDIVREIPLEHIVIETDSPYLAPTPFRGKRNESSYCKIIAEKIAEIKSLSPEEVAIVTTQNAKNIFGI